MLRASNNDRIMSFVNKMSFPTDYVPLTSHFERDYISRKARHTKYGNTGVDPDKIEEIPMEQARHCIVRIQTLGLDWTYIRQVNLNVSMHISKPWMVWRRMK